MDNYTFKNGDGLFITITKEKLRGLQIGSVLLLSDGRECIIHRVTMHSARESSLLNPLDCGAPIVIDLPKSYCVLTVRTQTNDIDLIWSEERG